MGCLAFANYDPSSPATLSTASLLAMTAIDTSNLRLTFTAPANGTVLVRLVSTTIGATTVPRLLLGVMDGSTVKGRMSPIGRWVMIGSPGATTTHCTSSATFLVTGLTPGTSYTWDAAYGVEIVVAATNLKYGGPDNATTDDAWGAFQFEIWETKNLLAGTFYDPTGGAAVVKQTAALQAMTAIDTTNLRLSFTGPSSGKVYVRIASLYHGSTTAPQIMLGVMDGSVVKLRVSVTGAASQTSTTTSASVFETTGVISVTPGTTYTWDAAYGVEIVGTNGMKYGGPNNTTTDDAFGGIAYEIWRA